MLYSCRDTKEPSVKASKSVELNNQGFVFLEKYRYGDGDESLLDSALCYFYKALMLDKNNLMAAHNRSVELITEYVDFIAQTKGRESALDELEKYKGILQQAERYETLKEYLLLNDFNDNYFR